MAATLGALLNASCAGRADDACASVVSYAEPVLTIDTATGPGGQRVHTLTLSRVRNDGHLVMRELRQTVRRGHPATPGIATSDADLYFGLAPGQHGSVICRVPCGFGSDLNAVTLTATGQGGLGVTREIHAAYTTRRSGCGGALDGGTHLDLRLDHVPARG